MFTIKVVDRNQNWKIDPVHTVSYDASENKITATTAAGDAEYVSGRVYVMNDLGKTVAVYDLDNHQKEKK